MNGNSFSFRRHKVALIDSLRWIENINTEIGKTKSKSLIKVREKQVNKTKNLIKYLNSVGKVSDKEMLSLLSLDFTKKKFNLKFSIPGGK